MKILEINTCDYGSTGKIMMQIAETANKQGYTCWIAIPRGRHNIESKYNHIIWIGSQIAEYLHIALGRITGLQGCFSSIATIRFLKKLDQIDPDIIHLHNLHNSYINIPMLFSYIKRKNIKVIWTLHDCWAFTGHCPYFTAKKCDKWKTGCYQCPSYREYPYSFVDHSKWMWKHKKRWFSNVKSLNVVTPSQWLADLVKESFLKEYPLTIINNGIDLSIFKPISNNFKERMHLRNKKIILGVAFDWGYRKGLDIFIELSKKISDSYKIILVGTNDTIDAELPDSILTIHRTTNQNELAEIYTAADVFLNPTREDNYPTVNMEAIACGTPVITFNTGGSPEMILNSNCGQVIYTENIDDIIKAIAKLTEKDSKDCSRFASVFDKEEKFSAYMHLYEEIK